MMLGLISGGIWSLTIPAGGTTSYVSPDASYIRTRCGLNSLIEFLGREADEWSDTVLLDAKLMELLPAQEAKVALRVTEAVMDGALTIRKAIALRDAVALRVGQTYLISPEVQEATGSQRPLTMNGMTIDQALEALALEARELEGLVMGGIYRERALLRVRS